MHPNTMLNGVLLTRVVGILLIVCLAECAAGSCLSYGHSCWGAHGKRSSRRGLGQLETVRPLPLSERLFISRLLQRPDLRAAPHVPNSYAINSIDAASEPLWQRSRPMMQMNLDAAEDRGDYNNIGKLLFSDNSEDQQPDDASLPDFTFSDNTVPRTNPANLRQILKDTNSGIQ